MKDYFAGVTKEDIYTAEIVVEEKIHDTIPKYYNTNLSDIFSNQGNFELNMDGAMKEMILKEKFNEIGMFCFVSWDWINPFAEWIGDRSCLEVMAGRGWITHGLQEKGVDIVATDDFSWHKTDRFKKWNNLVADVEELDAIESVKKYGKYTDILIMAWAYMDDTAYRVIKELHKINPKAIVVFCGEGHGGCTANDNFFNSFEEIEDTVFYGSVAQKYKTWYGLYDQLTIGRYNSDTK